MLKSNAKTNAAAEVDAKMVTAAQGGVFLFKEGAGT